MLGTEGPVSTHRIVEPFGGIHAGHSPAQECARGGDACACIEVSGCIIDYYRFRIEFCPD